MDVFILFGGLIVALLVGTVIGWFLHGKTAGGDAGKVTQMENDLRDARDAEIAARTNLENERERVKQLTEIRGEMEKSFKSLAADIAAKNSDTFLKQAGEQFKSLKETSERDLDAKKQLIDKSLTGMNEKLDNIHRQSTELKSSIDTSQKTTAELTENTTRLREVLSSSQKRGQWGERMVEDILRFVGLMENINYTKQQAMESGQRPDFTFILPQGKKLNMDVKFPFAQYEKYFSNDDGDAREAARNAFLKTIRSHIDIVSGREYINPAEGTLEYVMMFIPNESIYGFINSEDSSLIDYALKKRVLLCSPLTLYAMLSLIHQATRNFVMNERASEVMALVGQFRDQWKKYVEQMDKLGNRIDGLTRDFDTLTKTRTRALEKPLDQIENIKLEVTDESQTTLPPPNDPL